MGIKMAKFAISCILTIGVALGVAIGLVYVIPIRGTLLTMIVMPVSAIVGVIGFIISANWAFGR